MKNGRHVTAIPKVGEAGEARTKDGLEGVSRLVCQREIEREVLLQLLESKDINGPMPKYFAETYQFCHAFLGLLQGTDINSECRKMLR